jgi:PAS domain S-box-containing protein
VISVLHSSSTTSGQRQGSACILIVDDNPNNLRLLAEMLTGNGYRVKASASGKFALQAAANNPPDLILLDILMPGMDGYEVCRCLKADPRLRNIPVIFISALGETGDKVKAFAVGGVDYISKPFQEAEVLARIKTHLTLRITQKKLQEMVSAKSRQLATRTEEFLEAVSERNTVSRELRESEKNYREIFNATHESIIIHEEETGAILEINKAFEEMLGYTYEEALHLSLKDICPDSPAFGPMNPSGLIGKVVSEGLQIAEWQCCRKNGTMFWGEITLKKSEIGGQGRVITVIRDISERKKAAQQQKKLESQLRQAQKMEAIGTLAGGIAHDFNNILTGVFGYIDLAKIHSDQPEQLQNDLDRLANSAIRARDLVKQILTFSRQSDAEIQPLQPHLVINEALKLLRASIPPNIDIQSTVPDSGMILADPTQIHQVVMNLCTNSYHAMKQKGGTLTVTLEQMSLEPNDQPVLSAILAAGPYLLLTVSDTGIGMTRATIDKIFDPYFTTKPKEEGTGLGLSVTLSIVKNYGGHISVYSEPGRGSTFKVYLPKVSSDMQVIPETARGSVMGGTEHILVVDDDQTIVMMMKEMLISLGYRVSVCSNGMDAFRAIELHPDAFQLMISDLIMPQMTGMELGKKVMMKAPQLKMILCTGLADTKNGDLLGQAGFRRRLMKPVIMRDLAYAVREVLDEP